MSTNRQSLPQPDGIVLQPFPSRKTIELYMEAVHDGERVCTKAMYINPKDRIIFEYMAGEDFKPTGGSQNSRHEAHIGDGNEGVENDKQQEYTEAPIGSGERKRQRPVNRCPSHVQLVRSYCGSVP